MAPASPATVAHAQGVLRGPVRSGNGRLMPELPEVETVCRGLAIALEGRRLTRVDVNRPDLRFPLPTDLTARLTGRRVERVWRRAKYIQVALDDQTVMLGHLGMSGRIVITPGLPNQIGPHDHIVFHVDDGTVLRFIDPRRFGMIDLATLSTLDQHKWLAALGPEPLDCSAFTAAVLHSASSAKRSPIKAVLLDQGVVAGLGNIYVSEALHHARIMPTRIASTLTRREAAALVKAIVTVLTKAIAAGGSSFSDHVQPSGELGYFQHSWAVYGREGEGCPGCDCETKVERIVQSNRSTFYCAKRQR